MKNNIKIKHIISAIALVFLLFSCQEEDQKFGEITTPANLSVSFEIVGQDATNPDGDGSGFVNFTMTADNAITYRFDFGDGTGNQLAPGGVLTHRFTQNGLNTYVVTAIASGTGGVTSSTTLELDVFSAFNPIAIKEALTGGLSSAKSWYWNAAVPAHLGVGPIDSVDPSFYAAAPYEKEDVGCLYEDEIIFSMDEDENVTVELLNLGNTYFHRLEVEDELGLPNPGEDQCFVYDTAGVNTVSFFPSSSGIDETLSTQTSFSIANDGFLSYFLGNSEYEILSITDSEITVRIIQTEPSGFILAWYLKFTTTPDGGSGSGDCTGTTGDAGSGSNDVLVWSDEFDNDGAPCADNWGFDLGTGDGGWGNGESQYYTDRPDNVIVEDGFLKITAKAEAYEGSDYTSSRLLSKNKFEFQYGKVEVRAKLPTGGGTWPAIWMLGADLDTNPWPGAGEMDIMEHVGNNQDVIISALHFPGNSGGDAITESNTFTGVSDNFFVYGVEWTETDIIFSVDGTPTLTYPNSDAVPFNKDFFLILNVAMGGTLGGTIDPAFTESTMEIDYVRVYQ